MAAYVSKTKSKSIKVSRLRNQNLRTSNHKQPTRLKLQPVNHLLALLPPFLLLSAPNHLWFGTALLNQLLIT